MTFDRREFIKTTGIAVGSTALAARAVAAETTYDNYEFVGTGPAPGAEEAVVQGQWAYVATAGAITTVDLREPTLPKTRARVEGDHAGDTADVKVDGDVAGLTANSGQGGVSFFDVNDPANPEFLSFYSAASHVHNHFIEGDYAYLCINDDFGHSRMVIVDISDPTNPTSLEGKERGSRGAWMLRDVQPDMAKAGINPIHDIFVQDGLAYLCYWDAGVVVVDVTTKRNPRAVAHFGAAEKADVKPDGTVELYQRYIGGEKTNAHYVQPTPSGDYTFVGAETFPGPNEVTVIPGDHGGIRVFDTNDVATIADGGMAIYGDSGSRSQATPTKEHIAYIPAPNQPDDALLTSHNFDVTETKLFSSFYQGGIRAYDISDCTNPTELAAFAPDGTAFWTAENLADEQGETYYTVGSDIGKGVVVLELNSGSHKTPSNTTKSTDETTHLSFREVFSSTMEKPL